MSDKEWDDLVDPARIALEALITSGDSIADRIEKLEAKLAKAVEALEASCQIISQCTWTTMRVNGQYVDRREVVQSYRTTLAELKGKDP